MERREKKKGEAEGQTEVTRDLPNGVMTISLTPARDSGNAGPPLDRKLGFDRDPFLRRYIRSKNVEPLPVGPLKVDFVVYAFFYGLLNLLYPCIFV